MPKKNQALKMSLAVSFLSITDGVDAVSMRFKIPRDQNPDLTPNLADDIFVKGLLGLKLIHGQDVEGQQGFDGPQEMKLDGESLTYSPTEAAFTVSVKLHNIDNDTMADLRAFKGTSGTLVVRRTGKMEPKERAPRGDAPGQGLLGDNKG